MIFRGDGSIEKNHIEQIKLENSRCYCGGICENEKIKRINEKKILTYTNYCKKCKSIKISNKRIV